MQPILVAYGTTEGQSRKLAEFIAQRPRIRGHRVDLVDTASPAAPPPGTSPARCRSSGCGASTRRRGAPCTHLVAAANGRFQLLQTGRCDVCLCSAGTGSAVLLRFLEAQGATRVRVRCRSGAATRLGRSGKAQRIIGLPV